MRTHRRKQQPAQSKLHETKQKRAASLPAVPAYSSLARSLIRPTKADVHHDEDEGARHVRLSHDGARRRAIARATTFE